MEIVKKIINSLNIRILEFVLIFILLAFHTQIFTKYLLRDLLKDFSQYRAIVVLSTVFFIHILSVSINRKVNIINSVLTYLIFVVTAIIFTSSYEGEYTLYFGLLNTASYIDISSFLILIVLVGWVLSKLRIISIFDHTDKFMLRCRLIFSIFFIIVMTILLGGNAGPGGLNFLLISFFISKPEVAEKS